MTRDNADEIAANIERAEQSILAAKELAIQRFFDFVASRAYYATFYAATAILLREDVDVSKHSGVIAAIHQRFVKSGRLEKELGRDLNWLFELRNVGDYGVMVHVSPEDAERAILAAERFLQAAKTLISDEGEDNAP
jgi:uncharacterized protein (UPF0332 family)